MERILVVEDDQRMAGLLVQALTECGFQCSSAPNGQRGLAESENADLILVDVMMPVMDGFTMVEAMRQKGIRAPVIYLTAKGRTLDVVRGLEAGGDDYLIKPFKLDELVARVRAQLRRSRATSRTLTWADITLCRETRVVTRAGQEVFLSPTEFQLLDALISQPGVILSRPTLLKEVWRDEGYRNENVVEIYVNYLRKKTEVRGLPRVIQTVRGQGYVLALP